MVRRILGRILWGTAFTLALSGGALAALYNQTLDSLPDVSTLKRVTLETPMKIYTSDGKLIGEFGESKRIPVRLDEIPLKLRQAFLAIEDSRFYEHSGIDPVGILRAALIVLSNAEASQGASTITQQLARNFFLTREKTLQRKIREAFLSLRMEQVLTKDEIFELYLNKIALGHRAYGVAAAAQTYYGKALSELTLAEMATIAGLPKAPSALNPISYPERSRARRHLVLGRMLDLGYITEEEFSKADSAPYKAEFHQAAFGAYAPYVAEKVRQLMLDNYGENAYTDGLEVFTTVRSDLQDAGQYAVFSGITAYDTRHGYRGPVMNVYDTRGSDVSQDEINEVLRGLDRFHYIRPVLVVSVDDGDKTAQVTDRRGVSQPLTWKGMSWARPFKTDRYQGEAPRKPSDFMRTGDVVYVYTAPDNLLTLTQLPDVEAALVAIDPLDGAVQTMVGGYDFEKSKFDRTYQAVRQTGSNFKPFLYSAAVAKGISINSLFQDQPLRTWDPGARKWWIPKNSPNRYDGIMTLREALARSKNVVSIRLIRQVGVSNAVEHVQKFGFKVPQTQQVEAMALGSVEVTPLELVTGYAAFANGGFKVEPYLITKVLRAGQEIFTAHPKRAYPDSPESVENSISLVKVEGAELPADSAAQVLTHKHAFIVADIMRSVVYGGHGVQGGYHGTGGRAASITGRQDLHGKTGTTNKVHDAWFSGFNKNLVATAWIGFDSDRDLGWSRVSAESGATSALPIFAEFFKKAQAGVPDSPLPVPDGLKKCTFNAIMDWCLENSVSVSASDAVNGAELGFEEDGDSRQTEVDTSSVDPEDIF